MLRKECVIIFGHNFAGKHYFPAHYFTCCRVCVTGSLTYTTTETKIRVLKAIELFVYFIMVGEFD